MPYYQPFCEILGRYGPIWRNLNASDEAQRQLSEKNLAVEEHRLYIKEQIRQCDRAAGRRERGVEHQELSKEREARARVELQKSRMMKDILLKRSREVLVVPLKIIYLCFRLLNSVDTQHTY